MKLAWPLAFVLAVVFTGLVFLVYEKDVAASIIEVFVSAVLGGGLTHLGSKLNGGSQ